jgi:hypothetical protein
VAGIHRRLGSPDWHAPDLETLLRAPPAHHGPFGARKGILDRHDLAPPLAGSGGIVEASAATLATSTREGGCRFP